MNIYFGSLQVSTSCNEPKEDITLDKVLEKFFDLCGKNLFAEESMKTSIENI